MIKLKFDKRGSLSNNYETLRRGMYEKLMEMHTLKNIQQVSLITKS